MHLLRAHHADAPSPPPEPGPTLSLLYTTPEDGLVLHDARRDTSRTLATDVSAKEARAVSPSGRYVAFSYATADSSHLALLDLTTQTLQPVYAVAGPVTYSLAWHPDQDQLAFGHYHPTENGVRGPGGIHVATSDGTTRDVGCSAAREVLHWLPNGALATCNDEKLYVVAARTVPPRRYSMPAACTLSTTRRTVNGRRMSTGSSGTTGRARSMCLTRRSS
jgi:Tol biopolymer transport system component